MIKRKWLCIHDKLWKYDDDDDVCGRHCPVYSVSVVLFVFILLFVIRYRPILRYMTVHWRKLLIYYYSYYRRRSDGNVSIGRPVKRTEGRLWNMKKFCSILILFEEEENLWYDHYSIIILFDDNIRKKWYSYLW